MCIVCDQLPSLAHWTDVNPGASAEGGRQSFHRQLACLKAVGRHYGLEVSAELAGSAFVAADRKGHTVVCRNVDQVWAAMALMMGKDPDPLNPDLLDEFHRLRRTRLVLEIEERDEG